MALVKQGTFADDFTALADKPSKTAAEMKTLFQSQPTELKITVNNLIDALEAVTDSASGADQIGMTPITETGSANTVQEVVEALVTRLKAVTDSASGADLIGVTAIAGLGAAATVQAILEALSPMTTRGDITYQGASSPARLGKGTAYQHLGMNSGATDPEWQASAASVLTAAGDMLYASAANTLARLAKGTAEYPLKMKSDASGPEYGLLQTAGIAANAITQNGLASGSTLNPTTSSTSYVDLDELSVTLTTTGGDIFALIFSVVSSNGAGKGIWVAMSLDGASEVAEIGLNAAASGYASPLTSFWRFTSVAAGSHTIKGRWRAGTDSTATAFEANRALLVFEIKR